MANEIDISNQPNRIDVTIPGSIPFSREGSIKRSGSIKSKGSTKKSSFRRRAKRIQTAAAVAKQFSDAGKSHITNKYK